MGLHASQLASYSLKSHSGYPPRSHVPSYSTALDTTNSLLNFDDINSSMSDKRTSISHPATRQSLHHQSHCLQLSGSFSVRPYFCGDKCLLYAGYTAVGAICRCYSRDRDMLRVVVYPVWYSSICSSTSKPICPIHINTPLSSI